MTIIDQNKEQFDKAIDHLKNDIMSLRTGRAAVSMVEDIPVEAYGAKQPLKATATISVQDAKTITLEPWDKGLLADLDKAIQMSDLGVNPVNDGKMIRLVFPDLTSERRQELIKVLHQKLEQARIAIRKIREDIRGMIDKAEKAKEISEDERYGLQDDLDVLVKQYNEEVKKIGEVKEKDIMTV